MCAQSLSRVQLSATPLTVAHRASLSVGFPRWEYWSGLPFPSPEDLPDPGIKPASPALASRFFTTEPQGSPRRNAIFLNLFIFYWRIIALQIFVVFYQTSTWISHRYTYIPSLLNLPLFWISLPSPSPSYPSRLIDPCLSFWSHRENSCWLSVLHIM